jgi:hypothetical protein
MSGLRSSVTGLSMALALSLTQVACGGSDSSDSGAAKSDPAATESDDASSNTEIDGDLRSKMLDGITSAGVDLVTATCIVDALAETMSAEDFELMATAEVDDEVPDALAEAAGTTAADCAAETAGLGAPSSDPVSVEPVSTDPVSTEPVVTVPEQTVGTSDDPVPLGSVATLPNGYDVVVNGYTPDAGAAVTAANEFNDPAPAGSQYVLVNLTVTYRGPEEKATPAFDVSHKAVSGSGTSYDGTDCSAVVPDPAALFDDLFAGSSVSGNVCLIVTDADATDLTLYFDAYDADFNTATYYFSLA